MIWFRKDIELIHDQHRLTIDRLLEAHHASLEYLKEDRRLQYERGDQLVARMEREVAYWRARAIEERERADAAQARANTCQWQPCQHPSPPALAPVPGQPMTTIVGRRETEWR